MERVSDFQKIKALCHCIEELLDLLQESAEAAEIEKEYREIMRGEEE